MRIYFSGAESPNWRKKLVQQWGVRNIAVNFRHLIPRLPKVKASLVADWVPDDVRVMVHFEVPEESPELVDTY